jgi:hypothetical protein
MLKPWLHHFYVRYVDWKHNLHYVSCINFHFCWFSSQGGSRSGECVIDIDLSKEQDEFLSGHAIDGRILFPATGYLVSWSYVNVTCSQLIVVDKCGISVWSHVITYLSWHCFVFCIQYYMDQMRTLFFWDTGLCHWVFVAQCFETIYWSWRWDHHTVSKHCAKKTPSDRLEYPEEQKSELHTLH